jgi:hypothetical protein
MLAACRARNALRNQASNLARYVKRRARLRSPLPAELVVMSYQKIRAAPLAQHRYAAASQPFRR